MEDFAMGKLLKVEVLVSCRQRGPRRYSLHEERCGTAPFIISSFFHSTRWYLLDSSQLSTGPQQSQEKRRHRLAV